MATIHTERGGGGSWEDRRPLSAGAALRIRPIGKQTAHSTLRRTPAFYSFALVCLWIRTLICLLSDFHPPSRAPSTLFPRGHGELMCLYFREIVLCRIAGWFIPWPFLFAFGLSFIFVWPPV